MQFLRTLFWVAITILLGVFSVSNWTQITVSLWSDLVLETYLPLPIFAAFLLGLVPYFILHRTTRWSLQRKLNQAERQLAETRAMVSPTIEDQHALGVMPPSAAPIAVPPGVL